MKRKLHCVMLIDDNVDDNFYHQREILKSNPGNTVVIKDSGNKALDYLRLNSVPHSDLIFLDINMPGMNGWDFLTEYDKLSAELKSQTVIIMLTTSDNADDRKKMDEFPFVSAYITKPLTRQKLNDVCKAYLN